MNMVHNIENKTKLQNWIAKGSSILICRDYVDGYDNFHVINLF